MSNAGRMTALLHVSRHADDRRRADEWRRLHARPDTAPVPVAESRPRRRVATIRRLIARHA